MNNKNKIKISAGLNYHLHKRTQEYVKEKNISLTYLVENALELFFEEQKKIDSNKKFEESFATLGEVLFEINHKIDGLKKWAREKYFMLAQEKQTIRLTTANTEHI